jgi:hypothetical protein
MAARRFPPPWSVEETDACFIVGDINGQALTYVYFEEEPGRRSAAKLLTRDEAPRGIGHVAAARKHHGHRCVGYCPSLSSLPKSLTGDILRMSQRSP